MDYLRYLDTDQEKTVKILNGGQLCENSLVYLEAGLQFNYLLCVIQHISLTLPLSLFPLPGSG